VRNHAPREWRAGGPDTQPQATCLSFVGLQQFSFLFHFLFLFNKGVGSNQTSKSTDATSLQNFEAPREDNNSKDVVRPEVAAELFNEFENSKIPSILFQKKTEESSALLHGRPRTGATACRCPVPPGRTSGARTWAPTDRPKILNQTFLYKYMYEIK